MSRSEMFANKGEGYEIEDSASNQLDIIVAEIEFDSIEEFNQIVNAAKAILKKSEGLK